MIKPMGRLSPSTAYSFYLCPLKEVLRFNKVIAPLPVFPAARLGSAIHAVLEEASKKMIRNEVDFNERWAFNVKRIESIMEHVPAEQHLVPLEDSERTFEVKKLQTWKLIKEALSHSNYSEKPAFSIAEKFINSPSTSIGGRIDLVLTDIDGAEILDYKTGEVMDESGLLKEEYRIQMKLYAALYHETYSSWPKKLTLVSLSGKRHEVGFTHEECSKLILHLKDKLEEVNQKILDGEPLSNLANPSPEACKFCLYRPECQSYWMKREDTEYWPKDVAGNVLEKTVSGMGLVRIVIENFGKKFIIRGLSRRHSLNNLNPEYLVICNLSMDHFTGQFMENPMTTVLNTRQTFSSIEV
jgi:RecB family exonuclease